MQWPAGPKGHLWLVYCRIISQLGGQWEEAAAGPTQAGKGGMSQTRAAPGWRAVRLPT